MAAICAVGGALLAGAEVCDTAAGLTLIRRLLITLRWRLLITLRWCPADNLAMVPADNQDVAEEGC